MFMVVKKNALTVVMLNSIHKYDDDIDWNGPLLFIMY